MAVEVLKGAGNWNDQSTNWPRHGILELARAVSQSASWQIVDSFESTVGRIIGDPITGATWSGRDQTNVGDNSWFIAEQVNPVGGKPPMQFKVQNVNNGSVLNDPSGAHYRYDGDGVGDRYCYIRFSPIGGWDDSPASGSVTEITGTAPDMTIIVSGTPFTSDDLGRAITVSGMSAGNNVEAEILEVVSSNSVRISNGTGVAEVAAGSWTFLVDFAKPRAAGDNNQFSMIHDGSGNNGRWRFVCDDDFFIVLTYNVTQNFWFGVPFYLGAYNAKSAAQDTVAAPANMMMCGDKVDAVHPYGSSSDTFLRATNNDSDHLIGCLDENGEYQEWPWVMAPTGSSGGQYHAPESQPNEWDATLGLDFIEILVSGVTNAYMSGTSNGSAPDKRVIGSLKHVWSVFGLGSAGFVSSKSYLTLGANQLCIAVPWDGASTI